MSTPGEKNSSFPRASLLLNEAYKAMYDKDEDDSANKLSNNMLGADARGTMFGNDAHLAPPNLQQSTSSTTKHVCRSKLCNNIGSIQRKDVKKVRKEHSTFFSIIPRENQTKL